MPGGQLQRSEPASSASTMSDAELRAYLRASLHDMKKGAKMTPPSTVPDAEAGPRSRPLARAGGKGPSSKHSGAPVRTMTPRAAASQAADPYLGAGRAPSSTVFSASTAPLNRDALQKKASLGRPPSSRGAASGSGPASSYYSGYSGGGARTARAAWRQTAAVPISTLPPGHLYQIATVR